MTGATVVEDLAHGLDRVAAALAAMGAGDPAPYAALWAPDHDVSLYGAWYLVHRHADFPPADQRRA
jgi:hypothetical protein